MEQNARDLYCALLSQYPPPPVFLLPHTCMQEACESCKGMCTASSAEEPTFPCGLPHKTRWNSPLGTGGTWLQCCYEMMITTVVCLPLHRPAK